MIVTHLRLTNWRNFRDVDVPLHERTYLLGANASGKSNLLDVFRFLRDVSKPQGGGLQKALSVRGGIQKIRCLHARRDPKVRMEIRLSENPGSPGNEWSYILEFKAEGTGRQRTLITHEEVLKGETVILSRPDAGDKSDRDRLTQTAMEQIQGNAQFRNLASFFSEVTYLHLVPQLLKYGELIGGRRLEDDPFGQGFLERVAATPSRSRESRLKKIEGALVSAVPRFKELRFVHDERGHPHLEARYEHYRPKAGWQGEEAFSDGTLRLLGLLWTLLDGDSLLLMEEPELSLNDAIVAEIPALINRVMRARKMQRQLLISTHSEALLRNRGIDGHGVLVLEPGGEGTKVRPVNEDERIALQSGLSVAEVVLPKTRPDGIKQLEMWP
jgi:predicted ATPase